MDCSPVNLANVRTGGSPNPGPVARPAVTRHARDRQQQRVIPEVVIEGLLDFGESRRTRDAKAWRWTFSKRGWRRCCAFLGPEARHFERYRRAYAVTAAGGAILTVVLDWR